MSEVLRSVLTLIGYSRKRWPLPMDDADYKHPGSGRLLHAAPILPAVPLAPTPPETELGLNVDMTDVDRLRDIATRMAQEIKDVGELRRRQPSRLVHLMECLSCHRFGTPISSTDQVCGNCGNSTDTRMWFREIREESK
jgi:hypothetical protein